ncbi:protein adenylyltransferase Fic [Nephila pilipes]|uniref:Protein adenylyltransferase Fic n=1 Tax=Nephila pilipes TaxID=299642 RepID=A0A8X6NBX2_NEPPI|nr:protein adenylyltransferase Fic [Nephila pilipes]
MRDKYTFAYSIVFTIVFLLLFITITFVYNRTPENSKLSDTTTDLTNKSLGACVVQYNAAITCPRKFSNLTTIQNCLQGSNGIELISEESFSTDEFNKVFATPKYKIHGSEQEALTTVQMALKMKDSMKFEKAKKLFEHALVLQPLHPDVLNHYAEFLEDTMYDIITADHLYVKALILCPNHSRALINRRRTMPLVEIMDQRELDRIHRKRIDLMLFNHNQSSTKRIKKEVYFLHIYHTLAIEGNTMSVAQTRTVVETKTVVPGKSIMEHNEILGLESALRYINKTHVINSENLTILDILEIHKRVLGHVDPLSAGTFRRNQVFVGDYVPPAASDVEYLMEKFLDWFQSRNMQHLHPVKQAALAHYKLAHIHPFVDGNGRTARLLMNLVLMRAGYPPVIIRKQDRSIYFNTLQMANEGDVRPFVRFIAHCIECTLDVYLNSQRYDTPCFRTLKMKMSNSNTIIPL